MNSLDETIKEVMGLSNPNDTIIAAKYYDSDSGRKATIINHDRSLNQYKAALEHARINK